MNQEEINAMFNYEHMDVIRTQEALRILRKERDRLLAESDWITLRSYSMGVPVPEDWALYQNELRDLPQVTNPSITTISEDNPLGISGVTWPMKPS